MPARRIDAPIPTTTIGTCIPSIVYTPWTIARLIIPSLDKRKVLVLFVPTGHYYTLPGGGVESNSDFALTAERQVLEETGCIVKLEGACVGCISMCLPRWYRATSHAKSTDAIEQKSIASTESTKVRGVTAPG